MKGKRGALELSIGTIVIIVLALSMLILGVVLVRTIMCGAIGLTGDLNNKVQSEINKLFGATGGEVQCIGMGDEAATMIPGKTNNIWCAIKAPVTADYELEVESIEGSISKETTLESWIGIGGRKWRGNVAPGDEVPKKVLRLDLPENAPEENIVVRLVARKDGSIISTQDLDFVVSRQGIVKAAIC